MRSVWITSTSINIKYIRVFDAVVNFFPGVFCNCVYVYLYIVAVDVYCVYVCGCCSTGFLFALTAFYIQTPFTIPFPLCQPKSPKQVILFTISLTITISPHAVVPYAESPKKRGLSPLSL